MLYTFYYNLKKKFASDLPTQCLNTKRVFAHEPPGKPFLKILSFHSLIVGVDQILHYTFVVPLLANSEISEN